MDKRLSAYPVRLGIALILLSLTIACLPFLPTTTPSTSTPATATTAAPTPTATSTPTPSPSPTPTPPPPDLYLSAQDITLYPGPDRYNGDIITMDVTPRNLGQINPHDIGVRILRHTASGTEVIVEGTVGYPTFDLTPRARFVWAWDTAGLSGEETLTIWIDPDDTIQEGDENQSNNVITLDVELLPRLERPPLEQSGAWATTTTECCIFHYVTGTAGERDLDLIIAEAEEGVAHTEDLLSAHLPHPLDIYLVGRVLGHGGYAQHGLTLSHLDRHYAGFDLETVVRHETTHVIDTAVLSEWAPSLAREGLAVWAAGGHFKVEPIPQRAAALLELDWYIPLDELANDFYRQQHEIGYLEGAAFVTFLIDRYEWGGFLAFYTSFNGSHDTAAEVLDAALEENFDMGLAETEVAFLHWLERHPPTEAQVQDLAITVRLFDTIRRYQELYDPMAYFMIGWLPDAATAEENGIVSDFLRHPRTPENIALETMLIAAQQALRESAFGEAERLLREVERVLDEGGFASSPLAEDYLSAVLTTAAAGYEAQQITLEGPVARVLAIADWPTLAELTLERTSAGWALVD